MNCAMKKFVWYINSSYMHNTIFIATIKSLVFFQKNSTIDISFLATSIDDINEYE